MQALHACAPAKEVAAPEWALTTRDAPPGGSGGGAAAPGGREPDGLAVPNQSVLFYGVRGQQYQV